MIEARYMTYIAVNLIAVLLGQFLSGYGALIPYYS